MRAWLRSLIAEDGRNLREVEAQIESATQRFADNVWQGIEPDIDALQGDTIEPDPTNRYQYDRIEQSAIYHADREIDVLRAGVIGALITRVGVAGDFLSSELNTNIDPVAVASATIRGLDNQIIAAKQDALERIGSFIEDLKQTRSSRDVVKRNARQRVGMLATFTDFVSDNALYKADRRVKQAQFDGSAAELLLYVGPDDDVIRDWCEERVNKAAPKEYWETEENDVGPNPPLSYGGGYNCRHRLIPVMKDWLTNEEIIGTKK